jgi:chemotaxis protein CheZ
MGGCEYTIPILKVQEIINMPSITKLPQSPHYIEGVTNLRGRIITVLSLKKLVGFSGAEGGSSEQKVIVITGGKLTFGMLVDGITGVITINEADIELAENIMQYPIKQVEGVARVDDRLVVLLDTRKLISVEDASLFEDEIYEVGETIGDKVEVIRKIDGMGGELTVKEVKDAREFFNKKGIGSDDPRYALFDDMVAFMNAVASEDYETADDAIQNMMNKGQSDLFKQVGKVTRKLHDSIRSFKEALDPRLKDMASTDMPNAVDKLQFVIDKTEEAANKTMGIVEKYILDMDELSGHIRNVTGPEDSVKYIKDYKNRLEDDLTEILTTQSFQDLTGQTIKKVIVLVSDIETELVKLIATFGVKIEPGAKAVEEITPEQVSQEGVDDLLKEFGF